jgi:DNA-binding winged helix-turn-helix (wHTH) protein/TolB-like protein/Tfp pilus assembly protein PilF
MSPQDNILYEFEDFRLDIAEKTLTRLGTVVPVTPKVFETLQSFLENSGHLIRKDELIKRLWPDRFVEESNLTFNIKMLRKALGDDARNPRFIETVPRCGYRFIAKVSLIAAEGFEREMNGSSQSIRVLDQSGNSNIVGKDRLSGEDSATKISRLKSSIIDGLSLRLLLSSVLLFAVLGFGYYFFATARLEQTRSAKRTIAVLPLRPIDPGNRDAIFELGIADALINKFNSMEGITARPLSSIRQYADLAQDPLKAGKDQQVDFVVSSNYQLSETRIRVTWQLLNVATREIEDNRTTEAATGDVFVMNDSIAQQIGQQVGKRFLTSVGTGFQAGGTANEEAYRLYLQGLYSYDKRTVKDAQNAVEKFEQAILLDPGYAKAWAGKAHAHRSIGNFGGSHSPHDAYRDSMNAVNKALEIEPSLSDAYSARCENKFFYEYDFAAAETECRRAIELDPKSYLAHEIYSRCSGRSAVSTKP